MPGTRKHGLRSLFVRRSPASGRSPGSGGSTPPAGRAWILPRSAWSPAAIRPSTVPVLRAPGSGRRRRLANGEPQSARERSARPVGQQCTGQARPAARARIVPIAMALAVPARHRSDRLEKAQPRGLPLDNPVSLGGAFPHLGPVRRLFGVRNRPDDALPVGSRLRRKPANGHAGARHSPCSAGPETGSSLIPDRHRP